MRLDFFIENPNPAYVIGIFFALLVFSGRLFRGVKTWPFGLPACLWMLYGFWEFKLIGKGPNIRVDLLLIYPLLIVAMFGAGVLSVYYSRKKSNEGDGDKADGGSWSEAPLEADSESAPGSRLRKHP
jgi:hypothetical protein